MENNLKIKVGATLEKIKELNKENKRLYKLEFEAEELGNYLDYSEEHNKLVRKIRANSNIILDIYEDNNLDKDTTYELAQNILINPNKVGRLLKEYETTLVADDTLVEEATVENKKETLEKGEKNMEKLVLTEAEVAVALAEEVLKEVTDSRKVVTDRRKVVKEQVEVLDSLNKIKVDGVEKEVTWVGKALDYNGNPIYKIYIANGNRYYIRGFEAYSCNLRVNRYFNSSSTLYKAEPYTLYGSHHTASLNRYLKERLTLLRVKRVDGLYKLQRLGRDNKYHTEWCTPSFGEVLETLSYYYKDELKYYCRYRYTSLIEEINIISI